MLVVYWDCLLRVYGCWFDVRLLLVYCFVYICLMVVRFCFRLWVRLLFMLDVYGYLLFVLLYLFFGVYFDVGVCLCYFVCFVLWDFFVAAVRILFILYCYYFVLLRLSCLFYSAWWWFTVRFGFWVYCGWFVWLC